MIINKIVKSQSILILLFFLILILILILPLSSATKVQYPEWKIKLSYMLLSRGKQVLNDNPHLAIQYFKRAKEIYPENIEVEEVMKKAIRKVENLNLLSKQTRKKTRISLSEINRKSKSTRFSQQDENNDIQQDSEKHTPLYLQRQKSSVSEESNSFQDKNVIIAEYKGISEEEEYKAEEKGPTVNTILDPYHPKHKGMSIPYYKDREGLKVHPWVGIRGEFMYDEQPVGIESLTQEAQEFNQRGDSQAKKYMSFNKKQYYRNEIVIHIKETLPKFYYIYQKERVKRQYPAKKLWNTNDVYYDDYYRRYFKIEYTIPAIKKIGYLKTVFRYGNEISFRANDPAGYLPFNSYLVELYTAPYSAFLNRTFGVKLSYLYADGEYKRAAEQNWGERKYKENHYWAELDFYNQRKYLRVKPHFEYEKERHYPSYNTWYTIKSGIKIEKELNGSLKYTTDWTYIKYKRDKDPYNNPSSPWPPNSLNTSCWTWENEVEYEIIRDLKLKIGLDYGNGLGFSAFDNLTGRIELQLRKPGLVDFRIGYRYIDYFNIDEGVDTVFFKFGWFI